jgi:hypothetical protein
MTDPVLHIENVTKRYPGTDTSLTVLDDVTGDARAW